MKEDNIIEKRRNERNQKIFDAVDKEMSRIGEAPQDFFNWIRESLFTDTRKFYYTYSRAKAQKGYCSCCRHSFMAEVKSGDSVICPHCGKKLTAAAIGRLPKFGVTVERYAAYIERIDAEVVERVFLVSYKNYGYDAPELYHEEFGYYECERMYLDPMTLKPMIETASLQKKVFLFSSFRGYGPVRWNRTRDAGNVYQHVPWVYPRNLAEICASVVGKRDIAFAAEKIPFRIEVFAHQLKRLPIIEALIKDGFIQLVSDTRSEWSDTSGGLYGGLWGRIEKMKSGSSADLLCVDRPTAKELAKRNISRNDLEFFIKHGKSIELLDAARRIELVTSIRDINEFDEILKYGISPTRAMNYVKKQEKIMRIPSVKIFSVWRDTVDMARQLKMPLTESVLFPKDLKKEHDRLTAINVNGSRKSDMQKLGKRMKLLEPLAWSDGKFIIEPLRTPADFYSESAFLNHCVKTYMERCARGETNIFGIRKASTPDMPFYTLTLDNDARVVCNLGKNNCTATKDVKKFVSEWLKKVVEPQKEEFIKSAAPKRNKAAKSA